MTAATRVYNQLKSEIVTCKLAPGQCFSEMDFARRFESSRTPVREACRRLEHEGLMQIIPFRGYFIAALTVADFHNLHELQLIVDPASAALAAQRANPGEIAAMEACAKYEYQVGNQGSYYEFLQNNLKLHVGIAQAACNDHLAKVVASIHTRLMRFFYLGLSIDSYGSVLVAEHAGIVEAIKARDPETARKRAEDHVSNTIRRSSSVFLAATEVRLGETEGEGNCERGGRPRSTFELRIGEGANAQWRNEFEKL
ncbi:MAG: GntR family transcriptional regulator [Candidatus Acidiferrales bacterium]